MSVYKYKGKWASEIRVTDLMGNRIRKRKMNFDTKKEALAWENEYIEILKSSSGITFDTLTNFYLDDLEKRVRDITFHTKKASIMKHLMPFFRTVKIENILPAMIRDFQNSLLTSGLKRNTIKNIETHLNSILSYGYKYYNLPENPFSKIDKIGSVKGNREMNIYTLKEFEEFISYVDKEPFFTIFQLLFWTGIRKGEMFALTVKDINFKEKTISINKTFHRLNRKDIFSSPKTPKSKRTIEITDDLCSILHDYINKLYKPKAETRIFQITESPLRQYLKKIIERNKLKKIRIHDFRHSHASLLIHKNINVLAISRRLGHENPNITLSVYSHLYDEDNSHLINVLNEL